MYELHIQDITYKNILTQVKFDWSQGEKLALMGPNGSGKSTLARIIAGIIQQESGEVVLDQDEAILSWDELAHWRTIGFVGQHPRRQTIGATVAEELGFGLLNLGMSAVEVKEKVERLATQIGLKEQLQQSPATLSGGERQRLVIAAILALQPAFLILDESLSMLDLKARKRIFDLLDLQSPIKSNCIINEETNESSNLFASTYPYLGIGQLWITHDPEIALEADRLLVLNEGRIIEQGDPSHILYDEERCRKYGIRGLYDSRNQEYASIRGYADKLLHITALGNKCSGKHLSPIKIQSNVLVWEKAEYQNKVFLDQFVKKNEFIGIVGPSGAGKTTLLESSLGLVTPITGSFQAFDESIPIPSKQLRNQIRLLQQEAGEYLLGRTVFDEVFYTAGKEDRVSNQESYEKYLAQMSIPKNQWQLDPQQLSGGERQKIALAAALQTKPKIVLFDEPLIGLDLRGREQFRVFLKEYQKNHTILYVTHDLGEITDLATRLWLIEKGEVTLDCKIEDWFKEREHLRHAGVKY